MLDHTGFPVSDYARSKAFYLQALAPLGYALVMEVQQHANDSPAAGFGANGKPDLWIGGEGGLQRPIHIAVAAQNADVVILALAVRARSGAGHMAVPEAARFAVEQIPPGVKTIAISFGSPYVIRDIPQLPTYFCAYGIQPVMQRAVVKAMFGEAPVSVASLRAGYEGWFPAYMGATN